MTSDFEKKQDLTGILDLQKLQAEDPSAAKENEIQDPFAVNVLEPIEQVDEFQSIDQIGMMDHPDTPEDPFAITSTEEAPPPAEDSFLHLEEPLGEPTEEPALPVETSSSEPVEAMSSMESLKGYSEKSQTRSTSDIKVYYPFHLKINGTFGPFERDKLLLFITDNPIGLSSSDLDLQLKSSKVFLPRISEYAAIKLIQDLRDSGLSFQLHPSDRETTELTPSSPSLEFHYQNAQNQTNEPTLLEIPIFNAQSILNLAKPIEEIDEVSVVQYVRTEMLEVENSPMIQEVIERMTESLKQKARLKGGNALFGLTQEITPLRLPSQYQIALRANVIRY